MPDEILAQRATQTSADADRLARQVQFLVEIDKLKHVVRRTWLMDQSRLENDAEHSWHVALLAVLLAEYAAEPGLDLLRVVKMLLIHDLVEIDAGDTYVYDRQRATDKAEREQRAAVRIFGLLPLDQGGPWHALWQEFEARQTPEARYAAALDRFQPVLHNYFTQGRAWREHGISASQVLAVNQHIAQGAPRLWEYVEQLVRDGVEKGYLKR